MCGFIFHCIDDATNSETNCSGTNCQEIFFQKVIHFSFPQNTDAGITLSNTGNNLNIVKLNKKDQAYKFGLRQHDNKWAFKLIA